MLLIHPSHVAIVNEVFTPTKEEISHWKELIAAVEQCESEGRSVVTFNGMMVDTAHLKLARDMLEWASALGVA
jgi:citrate lyase subunit beta/citryl-CoA lyase